MGSLAGSLALVLCLSGAPRAQGFGDGPGTAEFQYVGNLVYARPAGIAGAYTAFAGAEDAVGYNPAGLSRLNGARSFAGTLRYHFTDITSGSVTYSFPVARAATFAFAAAYINYGRIEEVDEFGVESGRELVPASFNPSLTGAMRLSDRLRAGATARLLSEYLGDFEGAKMALGWGVDLGMQYQPAARNLGFGAALLNVGRKETAHLENGESGGSLPTSVKAGLFYHPLGLPRGRVALDLEVPWHEAARLAGGLEYAISPAFQVRGGTRFDVDEILHYARVASGQDPGDLEGGNALKGTAGFTFQAEGVAVDYAVQYWLGLSWVHALTVRYALF